MASFLKVFLISTFLMITGCVEDIATPDITEPTSTAPVPDSTAAPALNYEGIISKNIQNLLCNSVLHAQAGRFDQAYHKLDIVKNDKLVALLNKNTITSEEFVVLDDWFSDLIEYLYLDIEDYGNNVASVFPFSCAGLDEQTEAIGEVTELSEEYDVDNANKFLRKVCYSIRSSEKHTVLGYAESTAYLGEASVIAGVMLLDNELENHHKSELINWIEQLASQLITDPQNYSNLETAFNCELYEDETPNNIIGDVVDTVGDVVDTVGDFLRF